MLSVLSALSRCSRFGFRCLLLNAVAVCVWAVPPTKDDGKKPAADDAHPADGRVAKRLQAHRKKAASHERFQEADGWQVALFAAEPELANPVSLFVDRLSRGLRVRVVSTRRWGNRQSWT